jgi:hypothetical protein
MLLCLLLTLASFQNPHDHGAMVMGFDQAAAAHHFYVFADGGRIAIDVKSTRDTTNRGAIRAHLAHTATMFGNGDFEAPMLVHGTKDVPGIGVLAARHEKIAYRYAETAAGGRVDIVTTDAAALAALHDFLRYQIREHKTGDALKIVPRR